VPATAVVKLLDVADDVDEPGTVCYYQGGARMIGNTDRLRVAVVGPGGWGSSTFAFSLGARIRSFAQSWVEIVELRAIDGVGEFGGVLGRVY
jgi:uncharacterized protein (DUF2235 family)